MVRLHDVMTLDVLTVSPETTLREAAARKLVGLVTTTDVLKAVSQHGIAG